jgi:hypothetical protein
VEKLQSEFVQVTLHTSQAQLLAAACKYALSHDKDMAEQIENGLWDLNAFLDAVVADPRAWPVQGRMAKSLKIRARRARPKGDPQPKSRRYKRATRHERRLEAAKERRRARQETVEAFNLERTQREREAAKDSGASTDGGSGGAMDLIRSALKRGGDRASS